MIRTPIAGLLMLALSACSAVQSVSDGLAENEAATKIAVQYATAKVITSADDIAADDVSQHVERVRVLVAEDSVLDIGRLALEARREIDWTRLDAADQLLLEALLAQVQDSLEEAVAPELIDDERRVRILTLLDWMAQAAALARQG